ncbi:MAG: rRNA maturation RNase YbeY [Candidatus Cloacimonetes bacterium]|nr:rRNA maturation RNase YbeY [Candidatus Cloacimonadota bacterium]
MTSLEIFGSPILSHKELLAIADLICSEEDPFHRYQISLACVESAEMEYYNKLYRGKAGTTDVLSFVGAELDPGKEIGRNNTDETALPLRNCDIIIDIKQLYSQKGIRTIEEEFRTVFIHGLLHLVGYDHIRQRDKEKMEEKEEYYKNQPGED